MAPKKLCEKITIHPDSNNYFSYNSSKNINNNHNINENNVGNKENYNNIDGFINYYKKIIIMMIVRMVMNR